MAAAIKTNDLPEWKALKAARKAQRDRHDQYATKTYEELAAAEREHLVKLIAVHLGLILDSPDK